MQKKTKRNDEGERVRGRYAGGAKEGKSRLLDEFCEHHGYERKYAIKLLQEGRGRWWPGRALGRSPSMNRCRKWWNGFGRGPSSCAASGWPRHWNYGYRTTRGTMGRSCRRRRSFWGLSEPPPWTGCWP